VAPSPLATASCQHQQLQTVVTVRNLLFTGTISHSRPWILSSQTNSVYQLVFYKKIPHHKHPVPMCESNIIQILQHAQSTNDNDVSTISATRIGVWVEVNIPFNTKYTSFWSLSSPTTNASLVLRKQNQNCKKQPQKYTINLGTHTHNCFTTLLDFFQDYPGELAPER